MIKDSTFRTLAILAALAAAGLFLAAGLSGCASYHHTAPDGEETSFRSFLMRGNASAIASKTTKAGTNYTRTVGVGSLAGETEVEKLGPIAREIAAGATAGAVDALKRTAAPAAP